MKAKTNKPILWKQHWPSLKPTDHKYDRGHVVVLGGEVYVGAAKLAALAALRMGAGLVTLLVPKEVWLAYASNTLSVMVHPFAKVSEFRTFIQDERRQTLVIGPGAGVTKDTKNKVMKALYLKKKLVLDADGLNACAGDLLTLTHTITSPVVLTPHEGEFKRLFPEIEGTAIERAVFAAKLTNAVIVLKGPRTVIAAPNGDYCENIDAPAYLATAGTGDVLSGMIAGLLAQGMGAYESACAAVWIHSEVGHYLGKGMISEDMPTAIAYMLQKLKLT